MASLFERLSSAFSSKSETLPIPTGNLDITQEAYFGKDLSMTQGELLRSIRGWVYACVTAISDEVASIPLHLYSVNPKTGTVVEEFNHPVLDLLYKVNEFTTHFDHFWLTQAFLEATGEAPWWLERGDNDEIVAIHFLQPFRIRPLISKDDNKVIGYEYQTGAGASKKITIPAKDIIFLKYPDPSNPFRGFGTLQAAAASVDIDMYAERWNSNFFKNAARPDSILTVKSSKRMTDEQKRRLKASLKKNYSGESAHSVMVLFGDMELKPFGQSIKDMDFIEQQKFSRDKICGVFRVPKSIIAQTEGVNFASSKTAEQIFARWTIKPKMERLIQQLNEFLLPQFEGTENMYLDFDSPVMQDTTEKLETYNSGLDKGWLSINEVRSLEGLDPVEGGDVIRLPQNLVDIGLDTNTNPVLPERSLKGLTEEQKNLLAKKAIKPANAGRYKQMLARSKDFYKFKKVEDTVREAVKAALLKSNLAGGKKPAEAIQLKKKIVKKSVLDDVEKLHLWNDEKKTDFVTAKIKLFNENVSEVDETQKKVFSQQKDETIKRFKKAVKVKKAEDEEIDVNYDELLLDEKEETKRYLLLFYPLFSKIYGESLKETERFIDVDITISVDDPKVEKYINAQTEKLAKNVTQLTNDKIQEQVKLGIKLGEGVSALEQRLRDTFDEMEQYRSERIARTETARYNVAATEEAFADSGVVIAKQWVIDPNTACEFCKMMDGKIIPLNGNFFKKGETITGADGGQLKLDYEAIKRPPIHPNCNCDLAPVTIKN